MAFQVLLENWRLFQRNKIKMANSYPCNFHYNNVHLMQATISFSHESGEIMIRKDLITITIYRNNFSGYTPENDTIINITILINDQIFIGTLTLPNVNIREEILDQLRNFER
ncbi:hypothetical protein ABEB36_014746 [Hypothenemus hampei]|uniref:Uncharacterized protein n=1 Tax=Hypothenemus hampei TaxID=57062 RepID=A0ABD1E2Q4_HYPHA